MNFIDALVCFCLAAINLDGTLRGVSNISRPGPPSGMPPRPQGLPPGAQPPQGDAPQPLFTRVKPPPTAPPPRDLTQGAPRPEQVKAIDPNRFASKPAGMPGAPITGPPRMGAPMRVPPPRGAVPAAEEEAMPEPTQAAGPPTINWGPGRGIPPPRFVNDNFVPMRKPTSTPVENNEAVVAESKLVNSPPVVAKRPRPPPPRAPPAGIPVGQPLPPTEEAPVEVKLAAPPRPAPAGKPDPAVVLASTVTSVETAAASTASTVATDAAADAAKKNKLADAPTDIEPPTKKGVKKIVVQEIRELTRYEKEFPEYEDSDDDIEVKKAAEAQAAMLAEEVARLEAEAKATSFLAPVLGELEIQSAKPAPLDRAMSMKSAGQETASSETASDMVRSESKGDLVRGQSQKSLERGASQKELVRAPSRGDLKSQISSVSGKSVKPDDEADFEVEAVEVEAPLDSDEEDSLKPLENKVIDAKTAKTLQTPSALAAPVNPFAGFTPPPLITKEQNLSLLAQLVKSGRLSIRCIKGIDIRKRDDRSKSSRIDPYIQFRVGNADRFPWKRTKTKRKQDSAPEFEDEIVSFDILDPTPYVFNEEIEMSIQVMNKSTLRDETLGQINVSIVNFMLHPYVSFEEKLQLTLPGVQPIPAGKLMLEFIYEEARVGIFVFTLYEARGLRSVNPMGKQNPYVQLALEKYIKSSSIVRDNPRDPYFAEEQLLMWIDKDNWVHDLNIAVLDEQIGGENPIGYTNICLLPYMNVSAKDAKDEVLDIFYVPKGGTVEQPQGEIVMKVQYMPSGVLTVNCVRAKNLEVTSKKTKSGESKVTTQLDSYVKLSLEGQASKLIKKSPVDKDGGTDPVWDSILNFDIVDQYVLDVAVYDQDIAGGDILIGMTQVSLLPVFKAGVQELWSTLHVKRKEGGQKETGDINLVISFVGPPGVAFPQLRPGIDAFDDSLRSTGIEAKKKQDDAEARQKEEEKKAKENTNIDDTKEQQPEDEAFVPDALKKKEDKSEIPKPQVHEAEFTEEEIQAAFRFIDLDKNNVIGAAEIRHILVCMGELITDEEIDMMISMCDEDGDGQVSYQEFRTLVLHPHPEDMEKHSAFDDQQLAQRNEKLAKSDLSTFQRHKELALRESKKKLLADFLRENTFDYDSIKNAYSRYLQIPRTRRVGGKVDFNQFCQLLLQEPVGENLRLFSIFDLDKSGKVDFREFLLVGMNFVTVDREERLRYTFGMFDEDMTGFISIKELEQILRGNHISSIDAVKKKAETVMKQAAANANTLNINEFIVISKKFPNIFFPNLNKTVTLENM